MTRRMIGDLAVPIGTLVSWEEKSRWASPTGIGFFPCHSALRRQRKTYWLITLSFTGTNDPSNAHTQYRLVADHYHEADHGEKLISWASHLFHKSSRMLQMVSRHHGDCSLAERRIPMSRISVFIHGTPNHWASALFWIGALLWNLLPLAAFSQEAINQGARYSHDESGRIIGLSYFGRTGLRQSAPPNVSDIVSVEISYGTILTEDDVAYLSTLENVRQLSLGGNLSDEYVVIQGGTSPLSKLKQLESLFLCKRDMCDRDLEFLAELPNLRSLEFLAGPNPWDQAGPSVTDACAESIRRAVSLRELRIDGDGQFSDRFVDGITQDLRELEFLDMDSEFLTDRSLKLLSERCGNLRSLDLWSPHFTDQGVASLVAATKLEEIWLECPLLTDESVNSLSKITQLRHLLITAPTITDDAVQKVAKLPALEILCLRNTPMSDEQFEMFANQATLESLFVNGRNLTTEKVLRVIATMPKLDHLDLGEAKDSQKAVNRFLAGRKSAVGSSK